MPKKMSLVDYTRCDPANCKGGICLAVLACRHKVLKQEAPFEMPDPPPLLCVGCSLCVRACPQHAVRLQ